MKPFDDVKDIFRRVIESLNKDRSKISAFTFGHKELNVERLEQAICNHMCDDHPDWFGITQDESHILRQYIHEASDRGHDYFIRLHEEFPEFIENENPKYIRDYVNPSRKKIGLEVLPLDIYTPKV